MEEAIRVNPRILSSGQPLKIGKRKNGQNGIEIKLERCLVL